MSYLKHVAIVQVENFRTPAPVGCYSECVEIVDFINPDGTPWNPVPPPTDPLECTTKTTTSGEAVLSKTLTGTLAVYSGGKPPVQVLYQWQRSDDGNAWSGITAWAEIPTTTYTTVAADKNKYVRFASKATDEDDLTAYGSGNNVGPITATEIGILSIAPPQEQADPGATVIFDALKSGDADPLYTWKIRSGPGQIVSGTNIGQQIEVEVDVDATRGQSIVVQLDASDPSASDSPLSTTSIIVVN